MLQSKRHVDYTDREYGFGFRVPGTTQRAFTREQSPKAKRNKGTASKSFDWQLMPRKAG